MIYCSDFWRFVLFIFFFSYFHLHLFIMHAWVPLPPPPPSPPPPCLTSSPVSEWRKPGNKAAGTLGGVGRSMPVDSRRIAGPEQSQAVTFDLDKPVQKPPVRWFPCQGHFSTGFSNLFLPLRQQFEDGLRQDGRRADELRPLCEYAPTTLINCSMCILRPVAISVSS